MRWRPRRQTSCSSSSSICAPTQVLLTHSCLPLWIRSEKKKCIPLQAAVDDEHYIGRWSVLRMYARIENVKSERTSKTTKKNQKDEWNERKENKPHTGSLTYAFAVRGTTVYAVYGVVAVRCMRTDGGCASPARENETTRNRDRLQTCCAVRLSQLWTDRCKVKIYWIFCYSRVVQSIDKNKEEKGKQRNAIKYSSKHFFVWFLWVNERFGNEKNSEKRNWSSQGGIEEQKKYFRPKNSWKLNWTSVPSHPYILYIQTHEPTNVSSCDDWCDCAVFPFRAKKEKRKNKQRNEIKKENRNEATLINSTKWFWQRWTKPLHNMNTNPTKPTNLPTKIFYFKKRIQLPYSFSLRIYW